MGWDDEPVSRIFLAVVATFAVIVMAVVVWQWTRSDGPYGKTHEGDAIPESVLKKATTTVYCNGQQMDIYRPAKRGGPAPAVLYAHPGGWAVGDKTGGSYADQLVPALTERGFVVASINYRLGRANPWPAQIRDAACAVRFLRAHHTRYGIDPRRIGAWGGSAGAQLMSLVGTMDRAAGFDVGPYLDQSSRLQAVVDMYGPVDMPAFVSRTTWSRDVQSIFRPIRRKDPNGLGNASPIHWVTKDDPPFLILQGDRDTVVRPVDSATFARRLEGAGVPAKLVMVQGGGHGLSDKGQHPSRNDLIGLTIRFFQQHLMPAR